MEKSFLKTNALLKFIGLCLLLTSITLIGCGKKGDLIRPEPPEEKKTSLDNYQDFFDQTEITETEDDSQDNEK